MDKGILGGDGGGVDTSVNDCIAPRVSLWTRISVAKLTDIGNSKIFRVSFCRKLLKIVGSLETDGVLVLGSPIS